MSWNKALPTTGSEMVDTATIYPDNWVAIEEWLDTDHYTFTNSLSGKHRQGETAVMSASTTAVITSATTLSSTSGSGAIGWSTDRGHLLFFLSGGWGELPKTYQECDVASYMKTVSPSSFTVNSGVLVFDQEDNDPYSLFSSSGYFTSSRTGKYLVTASLCFNQTAKESGQTVSLYVQSVRGSTVTKTLCSSVLTMGYEGSVVEKYTLQVVGCLELTAADLVQVYASYSGTDTGAIVLSGGTGVRTTFLSIKRIE